MKYYKLILIFVLLSHFLNGYNQDVVWSDYIIGTNDIIPLKSIVDNSNNIYLLGYFTGSFSKGTYNFTSKGLEDIFIAKYSPDGTVLWIKQIGSTLTDNPSGLGIGIDAGNNYLYVSGGFQGTCYFSASDYLVSTGNYDIFLSKYSTSDGNLVWVKNVAKGESANSQNATAMKLDNDNNIVITGYFQNSIYFDKDTLIGNSIFKSFIAKFNNEGSLIWAKKIETNNNNTRIFSIDSYDNGYCIAGHYRDSIYFDVGNLVTSTAYTDMFLYNMDKEGNGKWVRKIAGNLSDYINSVSCGSEGTSYIAGYYNSASLLIDSTKNIVSTKKVSNAGSYDIFFAKFNNEGTLQWSNSIGNKGDDRIYRSVYSNGNFAVGGQFGDSLNLGTKKITSNGGLDMFGLLYNSMDNLVYIIKEGSLLDDKGQNANFDNLGYFYLFGDYSGSLSVANSNIPHSGGKSCLIVKYDKCNLNDVINKTTCYGGVDGKINLTPEGTIVKPYVFAWTKDEDPLFTRATEDIFDLSAGTYHLTFTDALGYVKKKTFILSDPDVLSKALTSSTNVSCYTGSNGTIDLTVSGGTAPYTYAWTASGGSGVNAMVQDQTTLTAGSYSVLVTDKNGCTATLSDIVISQPNKITFTGTVVTKINGSLGSIDLSVHGGTPAYTYSWSGPSSYVAFADDISGLNDAGSYIVSVTDANSCKADTNFYVPDAYSLNVYLASKEDVKCKGGSDGTITIATANVTGIAKYVWTGTTSCTAVANNLSAGNYSVTVTDDLYSEVVDVTITEPSTDLTVSISKTDITCNNANNGVADANPIGGTLPYSYSWTREAAAYDGNNETLTGLSEGAYAVTVTDANGCSANNTQTIINPAIITFSGNVTSITCENGKNDGIITLSNIQGGTGSYTYLWSNGITTKTDSLLSAGDYTITITDANNCKASNNYVVGYGASIALSMVETNVTCNGLANGIATVSASGGYGGFTYKWSNDATTETITALAPKTYTVTVTDSKSCTKSQTVTITEPEVLAIASANQTNVSCFGRSDGSISVTATGGTSGYFYQWDNGAGTLATASGLPAATYNLTITDLNSCKVTGAYVITEPSTLGVTEDAALHTDLLCNGLVNGSITLIPTGGSGTYQYSANSGAWVDVPSFTGLAAGNYNFVIRDKAAVTCSFSMPSTVSITEPSAITISSPVKSDITCYGLSNGIITATGTGGTGTLVYSLKLAGVLSGNTTGSASGSFTGLMAGDDYSVQVTDANNCNPAITGNIALAQPSLLKIVLDSAYKATQKSPDWNGHIEVVAEGGTSPYTYTLSTAVVNQTGIFTTLAPGSYTVIVNDANSCGPVTTHTLVIDDATSVTLINQGVLSFFPNPTSDYLIVKFDGLKQQDLVIEFISVTGVTIHKEKIESGVLQSGTYTIDLQGIAKGLYLLKVNGIFAKEKILLQ